MSLARINDSGLGRVITFMGINIYDMASHFRMRKERHADALAAIKALAGRETVTKAHFPSMLDDDHFAFVTTREFVQAEQLVDAMVAWRWVLEEAGDGSLYNPSFTGEKLGDEEILFSAIAPFVESGSYIQVFCHDDECVWRWVFENDGVRREYARLEFSYTRSAVSL